MLRSENNETAEHEFSQQGCFKNGFRLISKGLVVRRALSNGRSPKDMPHKPEPLAEIMILLAYARTLFQ